MVIKRCSIVEGYIVSHTSIRKINDKRKFNCKSKISNKGKINGGVDMRKLNINQIKENKQCIIVSSKEALKDVTPINWSEGVLSGSEKVTIDSSKN